ncbi:MAG: alpha-N-acetylglucosaminidase [Chitinophagaceae bacterium]|nr:MAG: alpha-N-acetylglucosaminidase [Chitinophagaceae bacterium]
MTRRNITALFILLFSCSLLPAFCSGKKSISDEQTEAVYALIKRVIPSHAHHFLVSFIKKKKDNDCFEIEGIGGKIMLRGNNGIAIASALNYYLKNIAHCSITWNGTNLRLPAKLPAVKGKIQKESPYKFRYYLNYCTFNYTMSWWNWDRWQKEIDWMALNGINMPLAITGQNAIWKRVYNSMGFSDKELESFFSGPAYFNWFWMGNLDAWGGPLPQRWMQSHEALQKQILQRERSENRPPTNDSTFLNDVSKKVYQSMAAADPKATWIMQGWMFQHQEKFWQPTQIKALLNAVPNDKMIILDLWSERKPVWNKTEAYYGKPWIWCMLHNFGGNTSMYGRMSNVAGDPAATLQNPNAGKLSGIGLTPEGIEQNPVMYDLLLENVWRSKPVELDSWLKDYAFRRYGKRNQAIDKAWQILKETVYSDSLTNGGSESIVCARPTFAASSRGVTTRLSYRAEQLLPALKYFISDAGELKASDGFQYDLVDLTRQVLANYASVLQQQCAALYKKGDSDSFKLQSHAFLALISDMDKLVSTRKDFLLGKWLEDAKSWGTTPEEKKLYEKNARNLLTLWGDKNSTLREYACRQWAGLLNGYYRKRWEQFFAYVDQQMQSRQPVDEKVFDSRIKEWEWKWVNSSEAYADKTTGDAVTIALQMFAKYQPILEKAYQK